MSKLEGGIFSRPRGKTGGIVFGAARTRRGKQVTTRLLVPPSNPKTADQTSQRNKFTASLALAKAWGPDFYQQAMNRTVSQLAGFQALMSILLNNMSDNFRLLSPFDATLLRGSNPLPANIQHSGTNTRTVTWDTTPQAGGLATDEVFMAGVEPYELDGSGIATAKFASGLTIADGATGYEFDLPEQGAEIFLFVFTIGSGANAGVYSNIRYGADVNG